MIIIFGMNYRMKYGCNLVLIFFWRMIEDELIPDSCIETLNHIFISEFRCDVTRDWNWGGGGRWFLRNLSV